MERILTATACSFNTTCELMQQLLSSHPENEHMISEATLAAAARNTFNAVPLLELLLDRQPHIPISERVMIAAVSNHYNVGSMLKLLLARNPGVRITVHRHSGRAEG
jgi:hypothetical protein